MSFQFNFNKFSKKKKKMKKISLDYYHTLINEIAIIEFFVNVINYSIFTMILYFLVLHIILKGEY